MSEEAIEEKIEIWIFGETAVIQDGKQTRMELIKFDVGKGALCEEWAFWKFRHMIPREFRAYAWLPGTTSFIVPKSIADAIWTAIQEKYPGSFELWQSQVPIWAERRRQEVERKRRYEGQ